MKISEIFELDKSQAELDFVDINPDEDIPLFLDPFFLSRKNDNWSYDATKTLKSFFQKVVDLIRNDEEEEAKELFSFLHEPNTTCLGLSNGKPRGRGVGNKDTDKIFENLLRSKAIQTGLIQDIHDNIIFVDHFGKDKLSDMTTNIITKHLIEYTQNQCELHNVPLKENVNSGHFWCRRDNEWINEYTKMLVYNDKKIILVPKGVVSYCSEYTPDRYYNKFVLDFLQHENLRLNTALVKKRKNKKKYVTKKSIKETQPLSKEFLRKFSKKHPEVLDKFKKDTDVSSLKNREINDIDLGLIKTNLITRLKNIKPGNQQAQEFHVAVIGILELIFYPYLMSPIKEKEIYKGRKRIDIMFDNAARDGIFWRLHEVQKIPSSYIFFECKNYSNDVANPELDQIAGRFSVNHGKVGFIVCRKIKDFKLFIQRCKDTYLAGNGLVIPLVDKDLIEMLENYNEFGNKFSDKLLSDRVKEIIL